MLLQETGLIGMENLENTRVSFEIRISLEICGERTTQNIKREANKSKETLKIRRIDYNQKTDRRTVQSTR